MSMNSLGYQERQGLTGVPEHVVTPATEHLLQPADFYSHDRYAFVLGHPDDEMWTAATIGSLAEQGKQVDLMYVTNGDRHGAEVGVERQFEAIQAARLLGVPSAHLHMLGFSEKTLPEQADHAVSVLGEALRNIDADCVVTHDYEGGHHVHDITNLVAYESLPQQSAGMWVFPAYHKQPEERVWNEFIEDRSADFILPLSPEQRLLKLGVFATHATQAAFFQRLQSSGGYDKLLDREILRYAEVVDHTLPPTTPVGYDFVGSPVAFASFEQAAAVIKKTTLY